jgi:hypothetical protein
VGTLELAVLVVVSLGAALYVLGERGGGLGGRDAGSRARLRWALAAALAATPLATLLLAPRLAERAPPGLPRVTQRGRFLGSDGCKSCHPGEHASWARTYHRTMTQVARGAALLLPEGAHELSIDDPRRAPRARGGPARRHPRRRERRARHARGRDDDGLAPLPGPIGWPALARASSSRCP